MTQKNSTSLSETELAEDISRIESVVQSQPNSQRLVNLLLTLLDCQSPNTTGDGQYSKCQHALNAQFRDADLSHYDIVQRPFIKLIDEWRQILNHFEINRQIVISQIYEGESAKIDKKAIHCNKYMDFFNATNVIKEVCFSCYKIQIIPNNLITLMKLYFVMKDLKLPRNNSRKCMIEFREDISHPYKGYIYCESENEANNCLHEMKLKLEEFGLNGVYCGISHGCSEYGLKYPEFKYSKDGSHRKFTQSEKWKKIETDSPITVSEPNINVFYFNKHEVTLRDVICFETWIKYAQIIGDNSYQKFRELPVEKNKIFTDRIIKQADTRSLQLDNLRNK